MGISLPHQRLQLDEHFLAIPLDRSEEVSVHLALVVRKEADPVDGPFCRLRQMTDANVYLGCFVDCCGHVLKWLELWVRDYENIADSLHENAFDLINNTVLDLRWERQRSLLGLSEASHVYSTMMDEEMDCPLYIDLYNKKAIFPKDDHSETHWKICKKDDLLKRMGLAPYSTTIHRYLYLEVHGGESDFLPITPNAPKNDRTRPLDKTVSVRSTLLPFNRFGGAILVREFSPISVPSYLRLLNGQEWAGVGQGKKKLLPDGLYREIGDSMSVGYSAGRLIPSRTGTRNWNLESLYLKTRLFFEMIALVKRSIEIDKKPFFSLETSSFGIALSGSSATAPFLWDAELALNQASDAVDFSVEKQSELDTRETTYFRTFRPLSASIYRPEALGMQRSLAAEVTLLEVERDRESGLYQIDGTLRSSDVQDLSGSGKHLYFIDYPVRGNRLRLIAEMTGVDARLADKIRFKTRKLPLSSEQQLALEGFLGVEQRGVHCEILPVMGTPCDLYSLGVIGLELLFDGSGSPLALLKDSLRTLAYACSDADRETPLEQRIADTLKANKDLKAVLLPDSIGVGANGSGRIGLPPEAFLWERLIGVCMKMLPGLLKGEGFAETFSNESAFRLAHVFDDPLLDLSQVSAVLRGLCVGDMQSSLQIRSVLDGMIKEFEGGRE